MLLTWCGYEVQLVHVLGYQDTGTPTVLSQEALLNIEADALAKHKLKRYIPGPMQYTVPFLFGGCYLDNHQVVKNLAVQLWDHINGQPAIVYWKMWKGFTKHTWNKLDWPSFHHALREIPLA